LTNAPEIPAISLANNCCDGMFRNCTSLITIPDNMLPAINLADYCYSNMFRNCSSLVSVP